MPCPHHRYQYWRQNSVQHPICWACWLSCWTGWSPHLYAVPVLSSLPRLCPPLHHGATHSLGSLLHVGWWWELVLSPEPGSLLSPVHVEGLRWEGLSVLALGGRFLS